MPKRISKTDQTKAEFAARLKSRLEAMGVPEHGQQSWCARAFGTSQKGAAKWLLGLGLPTLARGIIMARNLNVGLEWLMTGRGSRDAPPPPDAQADAAGEAYRVMQNNLDYNAQQALAVLRAFTGEAGTPAQSSSTDARAVLKHRAMLPSKGRAKTRIRGLNGPRKKTSSSAA